MKFLLYFFFLISLLFLASTLQVETETEDKLENIAPIDEPSLPDNMITPDFDDDYDSQQDVDPNAEPNSIEPRKCVGVALPQQYQRLCLEMLG
ncbi:uncharacterized protein LDX57_012474 [Aspergillus melleus]|uniref:uncharacterized protein n=1 Tax=Aspergillus melleus TaxID=138277 RepID=UPI001E8D50E1|nr:uncharacterized protein LDX57_012474 [Aspergillus melleus]KAH8434843.1 hypothetical protein LDX57_012474 [Aspergillus melleus]